MSHSSFLFLLASPRTGFGSNSEQFAQLAAAQLPAEASQTWLNLNHHLLPPFQDLRHGDTPYPEPAGHAGTLLASMLAATDIVFVSPLHWYGPPASLKRLMDEWSAWMRAKEFRGRPLNFKAAMAQTRWWLVSVSAGDADEAEPLFAMLRLSAAYLGASWMGGILGHANKPGEIEQHASNRALASAMFGSGLGALRK
jgi:putative NADPH-quinone reductase